MMDPKLNGTDEIALWRAVRQAMQDEGSPAPRLCSRALRRWYFYIPCRSATHLAADRRDDDPRRRDRAGGAVAGGSQEDPNLAYARALLKQAEGDTDTGA